MDDIAAIEAAAAVAAAAAAMSQQPPTSPEIEPEIKHEAPVVESIPQSPLKRSRSPNDENEQGDEKRQRTEPVADLPEAQLDGSGDTDLDEITRMIQQAQESVISSGLHEDHPMPDLSEEPNGTVDTATNDDIVNDMMACLSSGLENGEGGTTHEDDPDPRKEIVNDNTGTTSQLPSFLQAAPKRTLWTDPIRYTRNAHALPTLGKVSVDVIRTLCENSLEDTIATINDAESDVAKEYTALKEFFYMIRKSFSDSFPLLYASHMEITSPTDREIIRVANLATTCASMFGANELGWPDLSTDFLSIFVPEGQHMPSDVAELYIGLKTQMFLTSLESDHLTSRDQLLQDLFVVGQEQALKAHHPDLELSTSEKSFLVDAEARRAMLFNESGDPDNISALGQQYTYEAYLDSLSTYLNDNMTNIEILGTSHENPGTTTDSPQFFNGVHSGLDSLFDLNAVIAEASKAAQNAFDNGGGSSTNVDDLAAFLTENISRATEQAREQTGAIDIPSAVLSATESATRATHLALQSLQRNQYQPTSIPQANSTTATSHQQQQPQQHQQTYQGQQQSHPQQQFYPYQQQQSGSMQTGYQPPVATENLPPNQSGTTEMLYEKARQAAAARSSTHARREGSHSTRRPWNPEEEKALMMGLDMVKGPHWSQILSLFGPNGSVSTILADRTQVQLKDKARNLKLFFLKTNSEMPYYLQCVTGELKTRAPGQLAKQAAEERAKLSTEDEKAHINGIMALGSMQNGSGQRHNAASLPASKSSTPRPTATHSHGHPGNPNTSQPTRPANGQVPSSIQANLASASRTHSQVHAGQSAHAGQQVRSGQVHTGQQSRPAQPPQPQAPPKVLYQHQPQTQQPQHQQRQSISQPQQQHPSQHTQAQAQVEAQAQTQSQQAPQPAQQSTQKSTYQPQSHTSPNQLPAKPQQLQQPREHAQSPAQLAQPIPDVSAQPKIEEPEIKQERVSSEDAAILDLARLLQQEPAAVMAPSAAAQATGS